MTGRSTSRRVPLLAGLLVLALAAPAAPQGGSRPLPKPEAVAETRLLMEGLNQANLRGLQRLLQEKPAAAEAWTYARGQALLIAETGNLLMLRPPRAQGQTIWMDRAADLRTAATRLARAAADRDYERSRAGLTELAATCNRCHQTFRVGVRVAPFGEPADGSAQPG
jgi:hypothetical protein